MDDLLMQRVSKLQQDQFEALIDEKRLAALENDVANLSEDLETHYKRGLISEDTLPAAIEVASQLEILLQEFPRLPLETSITNEDDMDMLFSELTLDTTNHVLSFERIAVNWLVSNVTNPYPSKQQKAQFRQDSGVGAVDVDSWFRRMRRAIGWTALCNEKFAGSKKALRDAWDRVADSQNLDDVATCDLLSSFRAIQSRAHALHPSVASTIPSEGVTSQNCPNKRCRPVDIDDYVPNVAARRTRLSSKSNLSDSRSMFLTPLKVLPGQVTTSRKRGRPSDEDAAPLRRPPPPRRSITPQKRSQSEDAEPKPLSQPSAPQQSVTSRKRRLSDSEGQVQRKRPFGQVKTRLHAVSDPVVLPSSLSPDILPKAEEVGPFERAPTPGSLFPDSLPLEVPGIPAILAPTSSLFCDPLSLPPLDTDFVITSLDATSPLEISICHWSTESTKPSFFPDVDFPPVPVFDYAAAGAMDYLYLPATDSPCPELDYSRSVSPSVDGESPLPVPSLVLGDDLSDKLRKLQEHQEAARKLEAEILCEAAQAVLAAA